MIVGILLIGYTCYASQKKSQKTLTSIYKDNLVSIEMLSDARIQATTNYANVFRLMTITDTSYQKDVLADIENQDAALANYIKKFGEYDLDSYEKENYLLLGEKLKTWGEIVKTVYELSTTGKSNEALQLLKSSGDNVYNDMQSVIRALEDYNIEKADTVYTKSQSSAKNQILYLIINMCVILLICVPLGIFITRSVTSSLSKVISLIKKTSDFDLIYDTSYDALLKHKDEMGIITQAISSMRLSLHNTLSNLMNISNNLAANSEELCASTDENTKTVNQVVVAINEIAKGNNSQAEAINEASSKLTDMANNIDEVDRTTSDAADNVTASLAIVLEGKNAVELTTDKMQENIIVTDNVNDSIKELSESIGKVGNISDAINSIAAQTNLLALNAAIEAARAGEAGKGFAVVAEEIRKLAEESSSAAKEIANIIKDTVEKNVIASKNMIKVKEIVSEQSLAVNVTKEAFNKIELSVKDIAKGAQEASRMLSTIDAASKEIAGSTHDMAAIAEQAAAGSEEISASSEQQLASIEMIANAANELTAIAIDLNNELKKFKL